MNLADIITYGVMIGGGFALVTIIWNYYKGLRKSPRDMWLLFLYKIVEYSAYAAMNVTLVLWLSKDCGLGDIQAGSFISGWSIFLSVVGMLTGALVDTIGLRKTQLISVALLLFSRLVMSFVTSPAIVFALGMIPLAIGFGIVSPLISVAIKRFTTKEGAALGFGLFYVLMNLGYAIGYWFFDWVRGHYAERDALGKIVNENAGTMLMGMHFSTYQMIFVFGVGATLVSLVISFFLRDGVSVDEKGDTVIAPPKPTGDAWASVVKAGRETVGVMTSTARERYFWIYMTMLAVLLPVRFVFFHFHYTFPKYGLRVLGEGAKIGSIYGVLNPVLIIFLVPLIAHFTKKVSSYRMMIVGASVSALACFIACIPAEVFTGLSNSVWSELIFVKWLGMAPDAAALAANPPTLSYWPLIVMIVIFTIGEAIWSPRLMQFTAEIAPKGREGTYIALAVLPFFVSKFFVGPLSGWLVKTYTPLDAAGKALASYPDHQMVWWWIGGMAVFTPIGLVVLRKLFNQKPPEEKPLDEAKLAEDEVEAAEETEGERA